ncbi:hypothetical protein ACIQU4_32315 [Streptomyces sp. NPDC090741]|uniref:hypothetical protein n=1 Tax=Streptomyces sp. NPDC090741 TaxID=3365967 RepID=UPI0038267CD0
MQAGGVALLICAAGRPWCASNAPSCGDGPAFPADRHTVITPDCSGSGRTPLHADELSRFSLGAVVAAAVAA